MAKQCTESYSVPMQGKLRKYRLLMSKVRYFKNRGRKSVATDYEGNKHKCGMSNSEVEKAYPHSGLLKISQKELIALKHISKSEEHPFSFKYIVTTNDVEPHKVSYKMERKFRKLFKLNGYLVWADMPV